MRIVEQTTIGKKSQETNEDGILATDDFVAVIDGSTSKTPIRIDPTASNGRTSMLLIKDFLATMPAQSTCADFCTDITERIQEVYRQHGFNLQELQQHPELRTTASCIVYSAWRRELWLVGDCQCLVDGTLHGDPKPQEEFYAEKRAEYIRRELERGRTIEEFQMHDEGRDQIVDAIIESCRYQNVLFSVIDGFPVSMQHVETIDCSEARELVLASDGYPFLMPTLAQSEACLDHLLRHDPLCISLYKASKGLMKGNRSFDDRSYVRVEL